MKPRGGGTAHSELPGVHQPPLKAGGSVSLPMGVAVVSVGDYVVKKGDPMRVWIWIETMSRASIRLCCDPVELITVCFWGQRPRSKK